MLSDGTRMKLGTVPLLLSIILALLLAACSSVDPREPKALHKIRAERPVTQVWRRSIGAADEGLQLRLAPVFLDRHIYTVDLDGDLSVLDAESGQRIGSHSLGDAVAGGLGHDAERFYYTTFEGELVALARADFRQVWRKHLTSEALSVPVSDGRRVFVQTVDGKVIALDTGTGSQIWRYDSLDPILSLRGTAPVVLAGGLVLVSFANGELLAFDPEAGLVRWKATVGLPQGRTELERLVDVDGAPMVVDDRVYAVAFQGQLMSLDLQRGYEYWTKPLSSYHRVALDPDLVYASDADGLVWAFDRRSGELRWKSEQLQYRILTAPVLFDDSVVVADFEGYLHFLSPEDGRIIARKLADSDGVMGTMAVHNGRLYVATHSGDLFCYEYRK
jgi:outer membrane protein assembly factor BamB